jgi:oligopeptide/dipeptide ABC transporter ATP-binding protein
MDNVVSVQGLKVNFAVQGGFLSRLLPGGSKYVHAVDGVSLEIERGEVYGLVGESGSGKSTLARAILRLVKPSEGKILFEGSDISQLKERAVRPLRRRMQIVFQDPHAALNPAMTVGVAVGHPLLIHKLAADEAEAKPEVLHIMDEVGLSPPGDFYDKLPSELSGGQKQRVVIARAMILNPSFIVADEPVAMLDMSVRARILELLTELRRRHNLTYLFITHDLATAKFLCDRIAIMYLGKIMEEGKASEVYVDPKHPYTRALLGAIPIPDPEQRTAKVLPRGEIPDAINPPANCRFHPRCPVAVRGCGWEPRDLVNYLEERRTRLEGGTLEKDLQVLGDPRRARVDGQRLWFPAGENPAELLEYLQGILSEGRGPLFEHIEGISIERHGVGLRLAPWTAVEEVNLNGRRVLCILFQ